MSIFEDILSYKEDKYGDFQKKLIFTGSEILGVRSENVKAIAKKYANTKEGEEFMASLPHKYFEEYYIHGFMIGYSKDPYEITEKRIVDFIPYIDNWAVCDSTACNLKAFYKDKERAYPFLVGRLESKYTYAVRFALVSLLCNYMSDRYVEDVLDRVSQIKSDEYYIKMAQAWLICEALIKQYDKAVVYLENRKFGKWVNNKAIQKATESYRITDSTKEYLRSLKEKD